MAAATFGVASDAERRLQWLGAGSAGVLGPRARLLPRTESIRSSKVEGLQVDARDLARGEARAGTGGKLDPTISEALANIDVMEFAIEESSGADARGRDDHNPCGADFIRHLLTTSSRPWRTSAKR